MYINEFCSELNCHIYGDKYTQMFIVPAQFAFNKSIAGNCDLFKYLMYFFYLKNLFI